MRTYFVPARWAGKSHLVKYLKELIASYGDEATDEASKLNDKDYLKNKKGRSNKHLDFGKKTECKDKEYFRNKSKINNAIHQLFANSKQLRHLVLSKEVINMTEIVDSIESEFEKTFANKVMSELLKDESFKSLSLDAQKEIADKGIKVGLEHYYDKSSEWLPCSSNSLIMSVVCSSFDHDSDTEVTFIGFFYHAPNCHTPVRTYTMLNYCGLNLAIENHNGDFLSDCNIEVSGFSNELLKAKLFPLVEALLKNFESDLSSGDLKNNIDHLDREEVMCGLSISERAEQILKNIVYCPVRMMETSGADVEEIKELMKKENVLNLARCFNESQLELVRWGNFLADNILTSYIDEYASKSLMSPSYKQESINYAKFEILNLTKERLLESSGLEFGSW